MEWQEYETEVLNECRRVFLNSDIRNNVHIKGLYSKRMRQIDVLIQTDKGFVYVIDAKKYGIKVDVKTVESFIGMIKDVGANYGIIVSEKGFTKAAINRAHIGEDNIEIDILNLNELKILQAEVALPYSGRNGVVINAPFGWIIDGTRRKNMVATFYQRGISFEDATEFYKEWAYMNFWDKKDEINSVDSLISFQNDYLMKLDRNGIIEEKEDSNLTIRVFSSSYYPTKEVTLYREFPKFILFVVLFSPDNLINRNTNKMKYLLLNALPFEVINNEVTQLNK